MKWERRVMSMAETGVNYGKLIKEAIHQPNVKCADGKVVPLYARTSYTERDEETRQPEFIEKSQTLYSSPNNIRRIYIGNEAVAVEFFAKPEGAGKLFKITSIDGTDGVKLNGNPFAFLKGHVMTNLEEIYVGSTFLRACMCDLTSSNYRMSPAFVQDMAQCLGVDADAKTIFLNLIRRYISNQRGTDGELKRIRRFAYSDSVDTFIEQYIKGGKTDYNIPATKRFNMLATEVYGNEAFGKMLANTLCGNSEKYYNNNWGKINNTVVCNSFTARENIYKFDQEKLSGIKKELDDYLVQLQMQKNKTQEVKKETKETATDNSESNKKAEKFLKENYAGVIKNAISEIKRTFDGMYASGYGVIKPYGMMCSDANGNGSIVSLGNAQTNGSYALAKFESNMIYRKIYAILMSRLALKESKSRIINYSEILQGYNYFPHKLLEFAFGRYACSEDDLEEYGNRYKKHATANTWEKYWSGVIEKDLAYCLNSIVAKSIAKDLEAEEIDYNLLDAKVERIKNVIVSAYEPAIVVSDNDSGKLKLRISDKRKVLDASADELCESIGTIVGVDMTSDCPWSFVRRGNIVEFEFIRNKNLCGAVPLFAYKALNELKAQGKNVSWQNVVIGKGEDDDTFYGNTGPGTVNFTGGRLIHITAGSRSGKGVMTLNILASAISEGIPIFYLDNKPDMAPALRWLAPNHRNMFAINGPSYSAKYDDNNLYGPNSEIDKKMSDNKRKPSGLDNTLFNRDAWYTLHYLKGLNLALYLTYGIAKGHFDKYGISCGNNALVVVDELRALTIKFNSLFNRIETEYTDKKIKDGDKTAIYCKQVHEWFKALTNGISDMSSMNFKNSPPAIIAIYQELYRVSDAIVGTSKPGGNATSEKNWTQSQLFMSLTSLGREGLVGFSKDNPHPLASTPRGRKYLTEANRYFAYVPDALRSSYCDEEGQQIERNTKYVKPYLILNSAEEPRPEDMHGEPGKRKFTRGKFVGECMDQMHNQGVPVDVVLDENRVNGAGSELNPGIGFEGYIAQMSENGALLPTVLEKSYKIANEVLAKTGYFAACGIADADMFDFLTDFRPEFMLSWAQLDEALETGKIPTSNSNAGVDELDFSMQAMAEEFGDGSLPDDAEVEFGGIEFGGEFSNNQYSQPTPQPSPINNVATPMGVSPSRVEKVADASNPFGKNKDDIFEGIEDTLEEDEVNINMGEGFGDDLGNNEETMGNIFDGLDDMDFDSNGGDREYQKGDTIDLEEDEETKSERESFGTDRMNQPYCKPSMEKATESTGPRQNKFIVNGSQHNPARKLDINKAIDCSHANRGISQKYENILAKTFKGQKKLREKLWKGILDKIVSGPGGIPASQVVRVIITDNDLYVNGKLVYLDGIIGGDGIHLEDIADFRTLFKRFPGIIELCTTENIAMARTIEEGVKKDFITYLFDIGKNLRTLVYYSGGANQIYTRKDINDAKVMEKIQKQKEKVEAKNNYDAFCKQPREAEVKKSNNLNGQMKLARATKTSFGKVKSNFKSAKSFNPLKVMWWSVAGVTVGTFCVLGGLAKGGKNAFDAMRK